MAYPLLFLPSLAARHILLSRDDVKLSLRSLSLRFFFFACTLFGRAWVVLLSGHSRGFSVHWPSLLFRREHSTLSCSISIASVCNNRPPLQSLPQYSSVCPGPLVVFLGLHRTPSNAPAASLAPSSFLRQTEAVQRAVSLTLDILTRQPCDKPFAETSGQRASLPAASGDSPSSTLYLNPLPHTCASFHPLRLIIFSYIPAMFAQQPLPVDMGRGAYDTTGLTKPSDPPPKPRPK